MADNIKEQCGHSLVAFSCGGLPGIICTACGGFAGKRKSDLLSFYCSRMRMSRWAQSYVKRFADNKHPDPRQGDKRIEGKWRIDGATISECE